MPLFVGQRAGTDVLNGAVGIVALLIPALVTRSAVSGRRSAAVAAAVPQDLDDDDRRSVVVRRRRRHALLAGCGGVGCARQRADRRPLHRWKTGSGTLYLDVSPVDDLQRREIDVAGDADASFACVDGAQRRVQVDVAGRNLRDRIERRNAGSGRRHLRRQLHIAEIVVGPLRWRIDHGRLGAPAGVDVACRGPCQNVTAPRGHDARQPEQYAALRIDLDIAATAVGALGDEAGIRSRRQTFSTDHDLAARREQLDVAAEIGVHETAVDAIVELRPGHGREQGDAAIVRCTVREQRGDGLASAEVAAVTRTASVVVFTAACGELGVIDLTQEQTLLSRRQHVERGQRAGLGAGVAELLQPGIKHGVVGELFLPGRIHAEEKGERIPLLAGVPLILEPGVEQRIGRILRPLRVRQRVEIGQSSRNVTGIPLGFSPDVEIVDRADRIRRLDDLARLIGKRLRWIGHVGWIQIEPGESRPVHLPHARRSLTDAGLQHDAGAWSHVAGDPRADAVDAGGRALIKIPAGCHFERSGSRDQESSGGRKNLCRSIVLIGHRPRVDDVTARGDHRDVCGIIVQDLCREIHDVATRQDIHRLRGPIIVGVDRLTVHEQAASIHLTIGKLHDVAVQGIDVGHQPRGGGRARIADGIRSEDEWIAAYSTEATAPAKTEVVGLPDRNAVDWIVRIAPVIRSDGIEGCAGGCQQLPARIGGSGEGRQRRRERPDRTRRIELLDNVALSQQIELTDR